MYHPKIHCFRPPLFSTYDLYGFQSKKTKNTDQKSYYLDFKTEMCNTINYVKPINTLYDIM